MNDTFSIVQLLHRLKIRSADGNDTLLKVCPCIALYHLIKCENAASQVIKNPLSRHLPPGFVCYGMSQQSELHNPIQFASNLPDNTPIGFVIGDNLVSVVFSHRTL